MLKNFHIQLGNYATNFALRRFCIQNKQLLADNNMHYITLQDLFPELPAFPQTPSLENGLYIHKKEKNIPPHISFPTEAEIAAQLQKFTHEHHIENIILIFQKFFLPDYLPALLSLKKTFPSAHFHFEENSVIITRELECMFSMVSLYLNGTSIPKLNNYNALPFINFYNLTTSHTKDFSLIQSLFSTKITQNFLHNEIDCLKHFLAFINIRRNTDFFYPNTFHPQVLAFLTAIREYLFTDTVIDFYSENDFLNYKQKKNHLFTYCSEEMQKDIIAQTKYPAPLAAETPVIYTDCTAFSSRIVFENACELAKLISPSMRRLLLKNVDYEYFPHIPYSSKIAYAALMLAECMIDEKKAKELLQKTKGRISTGTENTVQPPLLTVYTPTHNHEEYITQCIESVLAQKTKYPFKHLIIDDASTDGTQEILKKYARKYEHIELILRKKNNMNLAFYHFLQNTATKYVAWCDGDDFYIDEHKLEEQVELMENNPDYGLCFHRTFILYDEEHCIKNIHPQNTKLPNGVQSYYHPQDIVNTNLLQSSSALYRWIYADRFPYHAPINTSPVDWALNILHAHKNKIGFIDKPMSIYRRHKKAYYYGTEFNIAKHIIKHCINEIKFCTVADKATTYQYHKLFLEKMAIILDTFYNDIDIVDFDKEQYNAIKNDLEKQFPHVIKEVKDFVDNYDRQ